MRTQRFGLRANIPIVIETPAGMVRIRRGDKNRQLVIEMPDDMKAHLGDERAYASARFVEQTGEGKAVPKYAALRPVVKAGELVGVEVTPVFRVTAGIPQIRRVAAVG